MPKTLFRPQIDGSGIDFIEEIDQQEIDGVRRKFRAAVDDAIDSLRPLYSVALDIYDIRHTLDEAVAQKIPPGFVLQSGRIQYLLDFYNARRFFPKSHSKTEKKAKILDPYLSRRRSESLTANATRLLTGLALAYGIPDRWLPESWLVDPVKEELQQIQAIKGSTIDLNLKLPPGGNRWLAGTCRQEWDRLKKYLDAGKPWSIRLLGASLNPYENAAVIAYGYKEPGDGTGIIYVCDLNRPGQEQALHLKFHGQDQIIVEGLDSAPDENIRGFYCENYTRESPPPTGRFQFLRKILPIKAAWYIARWARVFWLWIIAVLKNMFRPGHSRRR